MTTGAIRCAAICSAAAIPSRTRHLDVQDHEVRPELLGQARRPSRRPRPGRRRRTLLLEHLREVQADERLVLGDDDAGAGVLTVVRLSGSGTFAAVAPVSQRQRKRSQTPSSVGSNPTRGTGGHSRDIAPSRTRGRRYGSPWDGRRGRSPKSVAGAASSSLTSRERQYEVVVGAASSMTSRARPYARPPSAVARPPVVVARPPVRPSVRRTPADRDRSQRDAPVRRPPGRR